MALANKNFSDLFTFTRASKAWDFNSNGALLEHAVDVVRQGYNPTTLAPSGWLIELQATNAIRNPRAEGGTVGVIGSGGVLPTNWVLTNAGFSVEYLGVFTINGIQVARFRCSGTANAGNVTLDFEPPTLIDAVLSQPWFFGFHAREVAAPTPPTSYRLRVNSRTSAGVGIAGGTITGNVIFTPTTTLRAYSLQYETPADPTVAKINTGIQMAVVSGNTYDFTFDVGYAWMEQTTMPSQVPALPAVGTPGASTRAGDRLSIGGSAFTSIFGQGAPQGWAIIDFQMDASAVQSAGRMFLQFDTGVDTAGNRMQFRCNSTGINAIAILPDGVVTSTSPGSSILTSFYGQNTIRAGIRWSATNVTLCLMGQTLINTANTSAGTTPFNTMRIGSTASGGSQLGSRVRGVWAGTILPNDAKFQAACVAGVDIPTALR